MNFDGIEITILEDGTIQTSTDKVSGPNHANAEQFLLQMARLAGGTTTRVRKSEALQRNQATNKNQQQH